MFTIDIFYHSDMIWLAKLQLHLVSTFLRQLKQPISKSAGCTHSYLLFVKTPPHIGSIEYLYIFSIAAPFKQIDIKAFYQLQLIGGAPPYHITHTVHKVATLLNTINCS